MFKSNTLLKNHGTQVIVSGFFVLLLALVFILDLSFDITMSDVLLRWCQNFLLVLAMVPCITAGCGPNFASPLGICCGLLGGLITLNAGFTGIESMLLSMLIALPFALIVGYVYGWLLNMIKGSEMMIATYVGFAFVSLLCIVWAVFPLKNDALSMALGAGVRTSVDLTASFGYILNEFLAVKIAGISIPVGFILICGLFALALKLFLNSRVGMNMRAVGENPKFAQGMGINIDKYRILGTVISIVLSAWGIIFYAQSFGMMQFYKAPLMMGFLAVAAILIGGATTKRASITHAAFGALVFNGILATSMPVANALVPNSNMAEIVRMLVSNGIIVYALMKIKTDA